MLRILFQNCLLQHIGRYQTIIHSKGIKNTGQKQCFLETMLLVDNVRIIENVIFSNFVTSYSQQSRLFIVILFIFTGKQPSHHRFAHDQKSPSRISTFILKTDVRVKQMLQLIILMYFSWQSISDDCTCILMQ